MTEYEVKCPQTWAWYTGYVHDYNESQKKLSIKYADDWKSPEWIDLASVRYKYDSNLANDSWRPSYNEEVECKARAEEREPYGWWPCKGKKYDGSANDADINNNNASEELYSVAFIGWGDQHNEILGIEYIRKRSTSAALSVIKNMYKQMYVVPIELKEWVLTHCANKTILETLMPHKNISSQIIHIAYLEKTNKLLLIGVKRVLITMKDIIYCFFEKQKSLLKLEDKTKRLEEESKRKKNEELKADKYTFNIHPLLSGYLRGRGGSNIERVKRMFNDNIIRIEPQNGSCYIAAKDKTALNNAVDQLQIVCKKVIIPRDEMGQIIGSQGKQIQDIKRKSQVIKVISWFKWPLEFQTLKDIQTHRYRPSYYNNNGNNNNEEYGANNEANNTDIPDIIKNATVDNIFDDESDIIDLSIGYENNFINYNEGNDEDNEEEDEYEQEDKDKDKEKEKEKLKERDKNNDALVIIGRKSRVELCIFMIEMTLNHFRTITKTRNNVRLLRQKINKIKGNPIPNYSPRGRRKYPPRDSRQQSSNYKDEQKDSPKQQRDGRDRRDRRDRRRGRYQQRGGRYQRQKYDQYQNGNSNKPYEHYQKKTEKYQQHDEDGQQQKQQKQQPLDEGGKPQQHPYDENAQQYESNNTGKKRRNRPRKRREKNTANDDNDNNNE